MDKDYKTLEKMYEKTDFYLSIKDVKEDVKKKIDELSKDKLSLKQSEEMNIISNLMEEDVARFHELINGYRNDIYQKYLDLKNDSANKDFERLKRTYEKSDFHLSIKNIKEKIEKKIDELSKDKSSLEQLEDMIILLNFMTDDIRELYNSVVDYSYSNVNLI